MHFLFNSPADHVVFLCLIRFSRDLKIFCDFFELNPKHLA